MKGNTPPPFSSCEPLGPPPDPPDDPQAARASTEAVAMTSPGIELRGSACIDTSPSGSAHGTRGLDGLRSSEPRTRGIDCNDYCLEGATETRQCFRLVTECAPTSDDVLVERLGGEKVGRARRAVGQALLPRVAEEGLQGDRVRLDTVGPVVGA